MISIQTVGFVLVTIVLVYSYFVNNIILFFSSLIFFPALIVAKYFHENGLPQFHLENKFSFKVNTISKTKSDIINEILMSFSLFKKFNNFFGKEYSKDLESSGVSKSITDVSMKNLKMVLVTLLISIIFSLVLFFTNGSVISFAFLFLPLIVLTLNRFELKTIATQRKKGVEKELWFFSIFCDIMDNTQSKIYNVFEKLVEDDSNLFPFMKKEGMILHRDVIGFGDSAFNALKNLATIHPSKLFSEFIDGYLTSQSEGGKDTGDYIAEKTREYQVLLKQKMDSYIETSDSISQMVSFVLIMYPMFVILSSTMTSGDNLVLMIILGLIFIPLLIFILIKKMESLSPYSNDYVPFMKIPIIITIPVFLTCVLLELTYWEMVIFPLIAWSITNYLMIKKTLITNSNVDKSIPRFVRDINRSMLGGSSFFQSFKTVQENTSYTNEMNQILASIRKDVLLGEQIDNAMLKIETSSSLSKLIIKIISFTGKSGEITPSIMEKLALFSNNYNESKTEISNKTYIAVILSYFGSLMVVFMVLVIPSVNIGDVTMAIDQVSNVTFDETLTNMNYILMIVISFLSMVLVSKIKYGTVKHSLNNAIVLILILIVLYYDKMIGLNIS